MRLFALVLLPLGLAGCVVYSGSSRPPQTTIVVPPGSTVYQSNGYGQSR